jgi:hypothetical protein
MEIMNRKEHLTSEGLQEIINLKASMNLGLSDELKVVFPNTKQVSRPKVEFEGIPDPSLRDPHYHDNVGNWLAGFTSGEGSFIVAIKKSSGSKSGVRVQLRFQITQHSRDTEVIKSFVEYLGCGQYYQHSDVGNFIFHISYFIVEKYSDITEKIIPFFDKYQIKGVKALDFVDFKRVVAIIKVKGNLTESGLEEIRLIKAGVNRGR